jgi:hypothetical protein
MLLLVLLEKLKLVLILFDIYLAWPSGSRARTADDHRDLAVLSRSPRGLRRIIVNRRPDMAQEYYLGLDPVAHAARGRGIDDGMRRAVARPDPLGQQESRFVNSGLPPTR